MTVDEMRTKFEAEWILVGDPQTNDALEVLGGTVIYHAKDRDEAYRVGVTRHPKRFAILYTGQIPANTAVVL